MYRKDGGDGTGHWVYEKVNSFGNSDSFHFTILLRFCLCKCLVLQQEDIEEAARAELWREELIEEIEQKVGGLRELEEAGKK